jgi:hypothetical protein
MNIILIDYSFTSDDKLKLICEELELNYEILIKDKKRFKLYQIWIDKDTNRMIAYSTQKLPNKIEFTDSFDTGFKSMKTYVPNTSISNTELPKSDVSLNVDDILDKISKYGIESLLKEEREFLDNSSKS